MKWNGVTNVRTYMDEYSTWGEIDMVMNIGQFLSGNFAYVLNDIKAECDPGPSPK